MLAFVLALLVVDLIATTPAEAPFLCPEGSEPVWIVLPPNEIYEEARPGLSCRNADGITHGPSMVFYRDLLHGIWFFDQGEMTGSSVRFHDSGHVWVLKNGDEQMANSTQYTRDGVKTYETILDGEETRFTMWYDDGSLKMTGTTVGEDDPYWLPDGSFNHDRENSSEFHGEFRSYYENGNLKDSGKFVVGSRDGEWTCSDETGEHRVVATFLDGKLVSRTGDVDAEHMQNRCKAAGGPCSGGSTGSKTASNCGSGAPQSDPTA